METLKKSLCALLAACFLAALAQTVVSQDDIEEVADSIFDTKMRAPVPFYHDEHNEIAGIDDCAVCHHYYEDGELIEGEASIDWECSECHAPESGDPTLAVASRYHLQCRGCHMEEKAGPVTCSECHRTEE